MKYRMMMNLIAGAGMVATPLLAAASDFGGGWKQDKDTGALYYSLAPGRSRRAPVLKPEPLRRRLGAG